jgi:hypothetical protein
MASILNSITDGLAITKYKDWTVFVQRLEELIRAGHIRKIEPLDTKQFLRGDEWYLDPESGEIYVHGLPNAPLLPRWTKVDPFASPPPRESPPNDLSAIPVGAKDRLETKGIKGILDFFVIQGGAVVIPPVNTSISAINETWYRDIRTDVIYRLVETTDGESRWERVPQSELQAKLH